VELRPRRLAQQKESRVAQGHLLADHVHMLISTPPKYAVSYGFIKGKECDLFGRVYDEKKRNFVGQLTLYPRSDGTKNRYRNTSRNRKRRIHV
jgi:REP element-mobilizing transposase RayT